MFYSQIINPTTANIQWQHNCRQNNDLTVGTIRVSSPEKLIPTIYRNKAAWIIRTLEEYLSGVSRSLILEAKITSPQSTVFNSNFKIQLRVNGQADVWKSKWEKRVALRKLLTAFINSNQCFEQMLRELQNYVDDIIFLAPEKPAFGGKSLNNLGIELSAWIKDENEKLKASQYIWTR